MSDSDYEGHLMQQGLEGGGLDFDAMGDDEKARLMKYMQGSTSQAPPVKGEAQAMQLGLSQAQAPNMSQPQMQSMQGLMGMATQGIQRVPNGMRKGLMGN